jgi:hypothetical protein
VGNAYQPRAKLEVMARELDVRTLTPGIQEHIRHEILCTAPTSGSAKAKVVDVVGVTLEKRLKRFGIICPGSAPEFMVALAHWY